MRLSVPNMGQITLMDVGQDTFINFNIDTLPESMHPFPGKHTCFFKRGYILFCLAFQDSERKIPLGYIT